ncbi:MAG TPA: ATP-binding protein [Planctomycetota bacterium]|nr:ATP-binding protein [Planctomycetota bacterium]
MGIIVSDAAGVVTWMDELASSWFGGEFARGRPVRAGLERLASRSRFVSLPPAIVSEVSESPPGRLFCLRREGGDEFYVRHLVFPLGRGSGEASELVHYFIDETREKRLQETLVDHLQQLTSMKEIIDTLYDSVSSQEVIYLILVAVTSQMGFGFNRAFLLEACGDQLRGTFGIGPSSTEDAHRIWSRLAELNLPSLRAIYEDMAGAKAPPDPQTQEIASRILFDPSDASASLRGVIDSNRPALVDLSVEQAPADRLLRDLLGADLVAVVPLWVRGTLAGVLIADNFVTRQPISEKSLSLLKTFSNYAAIALERSQLYDELRQSVAKLQEANSTLKAHQRKLLRAEKLSAIGELAARVSHEIRNPLVAIGGLARSLLRDNGLGTEARDKVAIIVDQVSRLEKFLRETLDFVKPEFEATTVLDVRDEANACAQAFRAGAEERGIALEMELGDDPLPCPVDRDVLHRALANILRNAFEAAGPGGRVRVSTEHRGFTAEIRVADSGPGISPEAETRIFEPFFTTKPEGTGLGLAIAQQAIRGLGGQIVFENGPSDRTAPQASDPLGSIFTIKLPLDESAIRSPRGRRPVPTTGIRRP